MSTRALQVGDVAAMPLNDGGYGACQVTAVGKSDLIAYAMDWYSAEVPTLGELAEARPLALTHHAHTGRMALISIGHDDAVPPDFVWLGNLPVREGVPAESTSYSGWLWLPGAVVYQRRWDHCLPAAARDAYRRAATRGQIEVDFGAGAVTVGAATARVDLTDGSFRVPSTGAVRWSALDDLARCTTVFWCGPDRGLAAALAERPIISTLIWRDAPPMVDLSGTGLTDAVISGTALQDLRLPRGLTSLDLLHSPAHLAVTAPDDGRWLQFALSPAAPEWVVPSGLHGCRSVRIQADGEVSAVPLCVLADLHTLDIRWRNPPGVLLAAGALAGLKHLAAITLYDGYGLDADTLPDLPALTHLGLSGLRRSVVPALKARYKSTGVHLDIHGAKADVWLAANLTNPFRDWADDDAHAGAAACKAYANAVRAIDKLPPDDDRLVGLERVLHDLVDALNAVDDRWGMVDTVRREEAGDAFVALAVGAGLPADLADDWFDAWRDF